MAKNNARFFADDDNFISFDTSGTNNNVIVLGDLRFGVPTDKTDKNLVYCSFKGVDLPQITEEKLDETGSEGSFCYSTLPSGQNIIKLAVLKTEVSTVEDAKKYIRGLLVDYTLNHLTSAGTCKDPLYEMFTYLSDGTLVSSMSATNLNEAFRKIQALQANFNVNDIGFYRHVIVPALIAK